MGWSSVPGSPTREGEVLSTEDDAASTPPLGTPAQPGAAIPGTGDAPGTSPARPPGTESENGAWEVDDPPTPPEQDAGPEPGPEPPGEGSTPPPTSGGCQGTAADGSMPSIDDFDDGDNALPPREGRVGFWYVFDDGTAAPLAPSKLDGSLRPTERADDGFEVHLSGGPYDDWGAAFGVNLNQGPADLAPCAHDVSVYRGVRFTASGSGRLRFKIRTLSTDRSSSTVDGHGASVSLRAETRTFTACFADLTQAYGTLSPFDPTEAAKLHWQADPGAAVDLP